MLTCGHARVSTLEQDLSIQHAMFQAAGCSASVPTRRLSWLQS
jgi:hypothetical protein